MVVPSLDLVILPSWVARTPSTDPALTQGLPPALPFTTDRETTGNQSPAEPFHEGQFGLGNGWSPAEFLEMVSAAILD